MSPVAEILLAAVVLTAAGVFGWLASRNKISWPKAGGCIGFVMLASILLLGAM